MSIEDATRADAIAVGTMMASAWFGSIGLSADLTADCPSPTTSASTVCSISIPVLLSPPVFLF